MWNDVHVNSTIANHTLRGEKNVYKVLIIYRGMLTQEQFGLVNGVTNIDASRGLILLLLGLHWFVEAIRYN